MSDELDELQACLAATRGRISEALAEGRGDVKRWANWRTHIAAHPIAAVAVAAVVGYWLVPRKRTVVLGRSEGGWVQGLAKQALGYGAQHVASLLLGMGMERLHAQSNPKPPLEFTQPRPRPARTMP